MRRHERCSISGRFRSTLKYHYSRRFLTYSVRRGAAGSTFGCSQSELLSQVSSHLECGYICGGGVKSFKTFILRRLDPRTPPGGEFDWAVHLSNDNAGVLRPAQRGQKPRVEQKGKSWLDPDFQYEYGLRKHGLSILLALRVSSKRCQKSYHRDNWLVAAKRS